ncbi:hypothetical protein CCACVL1_18670 [Corchorus capsularis]|uniref:Protein kinase domain-containing protein n=1 Tax=Corchorus capsularis TaxID=210143 RepID=A0A1R3HKA7_COCAP|nr:hypothetical protein CCACVL1_18670 [Corchorus capsularis]
MGLLQFTLLLLKIFVTLSSMMSVDGSSVPWPPREMPTKTPTATMQPEPALSLTKYPPSSGRTRSGKLTANPSSKQLHHLTSMDHTPTKALHPHHALKPSSIAAAPSTLSLGAAGKNWVQGPASSPPASFDRDHHHAMKKFSSSAPEPSYSSNPPFYNEQAPTVSPSRFFPPIWVAPAPAPSPTDLSSEFHIPTPQPAISPIDSSMEKAKPPAPSVVMALPPPPPNKDCTSVACTEPLTYTPPGSPCGCVWPIQVKLQLGVPIYTFFPLVSELAQEIAASVRLNRSQVRIMGANAASEELDKSTVLINLIPWEVKFEYTTASLIYKKFWNRQVFIKASLFGPYDVVYVRYPGLPPSPPAASTGVSAVDDGPFSGHNNHGQAAKPLGVDVPRKNREGLKRSMIAVIILSSFSAFIVCLGIIWLILLKYGYCVKKPDQKPQTIAPTSEKPSGGAKATMQGSTSSARSMSISSTGLTYTGLAKHFSLNDIEKATSNFDASRVIGEGGFGVVYRGMLDDGAAVAVKVLKREDQRGGQEFLAEVEMLSRLHHRNLVKLIGICTENTIRCLVYELVPNGSLESHLHGVDKETAPLDWGARMKIALGSARGLAYLHEDSSPRVIHRDFKSSNILLEHDFTPKVSDFGLARTALEEGNKYISTHVMGTFGIAKVAAIASMCVQPEVSHRPFMGEVVQALKLVCNEFDEKKEIESSVDIKESFPTVVDSKFYSLSTELVGTSDTYHPVHDYGYGHESNVALPVSDLLSIPKGLEERETWSRRHSCSGPLRTGRRSDFWHRLRSLSRGSRSEHGFPIKFWPGS